MKHLLLAAVVVLRALTSQSSGQWCGRWAPQYEPAPMVYDSYSFMQPGNYGSYSYIQPLNYNPTFNDVVAYAQMPVYYETAPMTYDYVVESAVRFNQETVLDDGCLCGDDTFVNWTPTYSAASWYSETPGGPVTTANFIEPPPVEVVSDSVVLEEPPAAVGGMPADTDDDDDSEDPDTGN